jgi:hypothetical protein
MLVLTAGLKWRNFAEGAQIAHVHIQMRKSHVVTFVTPNCNYIMGIPQGI